VEFVAIKDVYSKSATPAELLKICGLAAEDIEAAVKSVVSKKR
jgi:transketolase C-terminal domain/subunit